MSESLISNNVSQTDETNVEEAVVDAEAAIRPDWLPEKFWVEDKPAYDLLAKSYGELETKFRTKEDDLRNTLIDELSAEAINGRPESPEKYELPEIEGINVQEMAAHPLTKWWSEFAHDNAFDQDTFKVGIQNYLQAKMAEIPNYDNEMKALGDNAKARTEAVGLWVNQNFNNAELATVERICSTADGVKVMEKLMSMTRSSDNPDAYAENPEQTSEEDIKTMMNDRRYWHPADRNMDYIKKVDSFFQKKFRG
jgi:hypothetical protein